MLGDSCTAWRWDRVAALIDQLDVRGVLSVPVQSDGRPVGTLDVHATSRGLVRRS
jgi:GAF domain-containing protein